MYKGFFQELYSDVTHNIELRAIQKGGGIRQLFTNLNNSKKIAKFIKDNIGHDIYFGVCTREGNSSGGKDAVREVPALWIDLDFKTLSGGEERAKKIADKMPSPSAIVHSGNGYHIYWLLKEPEDARPEIEGLLRGLAKRYKGDVKAAELARILRVPGTYNYKDGQKKSVQLLRLNEIRYNLADLEDFKDESLLNISAPSRIDLPDVLNKCAFLQYCNNNRATLPEPLWYAMISNISRISPGGPELVHAMSTEYPKYTRTETDKKILHAMNSSKPYTCENIKETMRAYIGKDCGQDCHVKAPVILLTRTEKTNDPQKNIEQKKTTEKIPLVVHLNTITPEIVRWLWKDYIPLGKVSLIDGDPGLGKSTFALDIAARLSTGAPMPDDSPGIKGGTVLLTLEDGLSDTIVPRLTALGADLESIVSLQAITYSDGKSRFPTVEDIDSIAIACKKVSAKLVMLDPLMGYLGGHVNSHRDQDIRQALGPLAKMAEEMGIAVIAIRHLTKGGGSQSIVKSKRCLVETPESQMGPRGNRDFAWISEVG